MLDHEYKKKRGLNEKRSWSLTIVCGILFLAVASGVYSVLRYVGHDSYVVFTVVLPACFVAGILLIAALNGRKSVVKEAAMDILLIFPWWR